MASTSDSSDPFVEPRLKYNRVGNYAKDIISKDSITCIALHSKFIIIGTDWGNIHILDHLGNPSAKGAINAHSTTINQISIDSSGEHIASCSKDGKAMIFGLLDDKQYPVLNFNREIKAIAISPDFRRTSQFVTGDTRLLLVSKSVLSNHKHKTLQDNRTLIRNIKWNEDIIIYATDDSVFVYDMRDQRLIGIIDPDKSNMALCNNNEFYCRIFWINRKKFIIGWAHLVQICVVKENPNFTAPIKSLEFGGVKKIGVNLRKVESLHSFYLPDLILGIVSYDNNVIALIDPMSGAEESDNNTRPQPLVVIIEPNNNLPECYKPLSYEQIILKDWATTTGRQIHLDKIPFENEFYITSFKDLIHVREREIDDRIEFLIQNKQFVLALDLVQNIESNRTKFNYKEIGLEYIEYLLNNKNFEEVVQVCSSILTDDKKSWEDFIVQCLQHGCIEQILDKIPIAESFKLNRSIYMSILEYQFSRNMASFLKLIKNWPTSLYSVDSVIDFVRKYKQAYLNEKSTQSTKARDNIIFECLGILFEHNQNYEKSLEYYCLLKSSYVFDLIVKRKMFEFVKEKLIFLINHDKSKTMSMLMENINDIPPETIVKTLTPTPAFLYDYLDALVSYNMLASEPYHMQMVELYAEFKTDKLLSFLKRSDKYDLYEAIQLCENKKLSKEVIHLLGRVGRSKDALKMIMSQKNGVVEAIDYCLERNDDDLQEELIKYSIDKPEFIRAILERMGMDIQAENFIRRIQYVEKIIGLKESLIILLLNYEKRNDLISVHQKGRWKDIFALITSRFQYSAKPIICDFNETNKCLVCHKSPVSYMGDFVLFPCSHFFHQSCISTTSDKTKMFCNLCGES